MIDWVLEKKAWLFSGLRIAVALAIIGWIFAKRSIIQKQKAGDNSVNVQGDRVTIVTGLTYQVVRQIALDVFQQNSYQLAGVAADTAGDRAEQI